MFAISAASLAEKSAGATIVPVFPVADSATRGAAVVFAGPGLAFELVRALTAMSGVAGRRPIQDNTPTVAIATRLRAAVTSFFIESSSVARRELFDSASAS
ncbi:MAG TPA: hypothetical protein VG710_00800 [Opitutus sp.]|nr:hypothetical protein [Opitutus sp.]